MNSQNPVTSRHYILFNLPLMYCNKYVVNNEFYVPCQYYVIKMCKTIPFNGIRCTAF